MILRRGSTRRFDKAASITLAQLSMILDNATRGLPADFLAPPGAQLNDLYLIVHAVEGLKSGAYFFRREPNTLEILKEGAFRAEAHRLGLERTAAGAYVDIFSRRCASHFGMFRKSRLQGRPARSGCHWRQDLPGCVCPTPGCDRADLFDDDVVDFFSPHAKNKSAIFLLAIGKPLKCG